MNRLTDAVCQAFAALGATIYSPWQWIDRDMTDNDVRSAFDAIVRREWGRDACGAPWSRIADLDSALGHVKWRNIRPW